MTPLTKILEEQKKEFEEKFLVGDIHCENAVNKAHIHSLISSSQSSLLTALVEEIEGMKRQYPQPVLGMGGDMTRTVERIDNYNFALTDIKNLLEKISPC